MNRLRIINLTIEGLDKENRASAVFRRKVETALNKAVQRCLSDSVSSEVKPDGKTVSIVFNLDELPEEIKSHLESLIVGEKLKLREGLNVVLSSGSE